jgi:GTP-binding protein
MKITSAEFISSFTDLSKLPKDNKPEFAFIGRSNVGKSSLINMLLQRKNLARTSATPGKTQTINHFLINNRWYIVDLPGYGFAKVPVKVRSQWHKMINDYLKKRENLFAVFVLIDSRLPPQKIDLDFLAFLGEEQIPLVIAFTKTDKLSKPKLKTNIQIFLDKLTEEWEPLPDYFITSAETGEGRNEVLAYIEKWL